uniref:Gly-zipper_Omp domain-containing protein n=1 Tax=Syphacia muris TaxID=451379 RepID=A0A0N5AG25_9BILA
MSTTWLKNFFGFNQSDYELLMVPNPRLEYGLTLTIRGAEIGTLVGSIAGILAPLVAKNRSSCNYRENFTCGGIAGAVAGSVIGAIVAFYELGHLGKYELYGSCYRRRFDTGRINLDRACFLGATLGYLRYGAFGYTAGVDLAFILSSVFMKEN